MCSRHRIFHFDSDLRPSVALDGVDFGSVNDAADSGTLSIAGGPAIAYTADLDLTATPAALSSGDTLVFSNTSVSTNGFRVPGFRSQLHR